MLRQYLEIRFNALTIHGIKIIIGKEDTYIDSLHIWFKDMPQIYVVFAARGFFDGLS